MQGRQTATKAKLGSKPATQPLPREPGLEPKGANPTGEGLSLPGLGDRLQPKVDWLPRPIAQPIGAHSSGLPVSAWSRHTPGKSRVDRTALIDAGTSRAPPGTMRTGLGGSIGAGLGVGHPAGTGQGLTVATRPGPILAIPRDTLGDGSPSRKAASINQIGRSQGLPSTPANQSVPVQRWQRRGAVALGELLIAEAMGRPP